jgi:cytochrome c553
MKALWGFSIGLMLVTTATFGSDDGKELYEAACASCHGLDGRGAPAGTAIEVPLPDFTDCSFVTRETTGNWVALAAHGGRELDLSPQMPGFSDALSEAQIREIIAYLRGFCTDPSWPLADLNFPRPVFTGKAFPEDEAVLNYNFEQSRRSRSLVNEWTLVASQRYGAVAAFSLDLILPTGDRDRGLGDGTVGLGPSLRAGKTLGPFVLQTEIKAELPIDVNRAPRRLLYRAALQFPLSPLKRAWVPGLEFEADTKVEGQARDSYYLAPTLLKGLTRRGHVSMAIGAKIPVAGHRAFDYQIGAFLLWEYLDGGLWW